VKALFGLGAQTRDDPDGERSEEVGFGARRHQDQAIGLARAARHLGDQLGGRRADGCRQADLGVDLEFDPAGHFVGGSGPMACPGGDVQVCLVERDCLDQLGGGEAAEDLVDQAARLSISRTVRSDDGKLGAELERFVQRHRRADPVSAGLVGGAHDHGAAGAARHRHRDAAELGVVALVDGRVEGVQVDVEDGPGPVVGSRHALCSGQSATTNCGLLQFGPPDLGF
jgi:hypothetical protein